MEGRGALRFCGRGWRRWLEVLRKEYSSRSSSTRSSRAPGVNCLTGKVEESPIWRGFEAGLSWVWGGFGAAPSRVCRGFVSGRLG